MISKAHLFKDHLGKRGRCLLLGGILWILQAVAIMTMPPPTRALAPHEYLPDAMRASLWLFTAIIAMGASVLPQGKDRWGFFALLAMPAERMTSWFVALLIWLYEIIFTAHIPIPPWGVIIGGFATWGCVTIFLFNIAGWAEPGTKVILTGRHDDPTHTSPIDPSGLSTSSSDSILRLESIKDDIHNASGRGEDSSDGGLGAGAAAGP